VIAVGRLGDPARATAALADGKADFIALGRPLIADPDWPAKVRKAVPPRRCIACNTCVAEMRGGARIGCLVNGRAGRETELSESPAIRGLRIAVIGAGPAGLTFAHLVAEANHVTLFERSDVPGGALRQAASAPLFQEVEAAEGPIEAFIADLAAACRMAGVELRLGITPTHADLAPFDRVVIATGAAYRMGLGPLARTLLATGLARKAPLAALFRRASLRDWFYHRARRAGGEAVRRALGRLPRVTVIGDALCAGKAKPAITSAFEAALAPEPAASAPPQREEIPA
jgi:dimethylglycine catabolism A